MEAGNHHAVDQAADSGKQYATQHGQPDRKAPLRQQGKSDSCKAEDNAARQVNAFRQNHYGGPDRQDQQRRSLNPYIP
jgi:hypothetical protein